MNQFPEAKIYSSELKFISECVLFYPDLETGGDFFGFWSREGNPMIQYVTGPGNHTTRTQTSFYQDIGYLKECGNLLHEQFGLEHIGAWHSHHQLQLFRPSSGDVNTMRNALRNLHPTRFLISICNIEHGSDVSMGSFLFSQDNPNDYTPSSVYILANKSPIREFLEKSDSGSQRFRETQQKINSSSEFTTRRVILRPLDAIEGTPVMATKEKPQFSEKSYWAKKEGQQYLKRIYDKLNSLDELSPVEIKQMANGNPAISFNYFGTTFEIRFPEDYPQTIPTVNITNKAPKMFGFSLNRNSHLNAVQKLIDALGMVDGDQQIRITH